MILLDTHVLLWLDRNDPALGSTCRGLIQEAWEQDAMAVCAISFWEVAMLLLVAGFRSARPQTSGGSIG